MKHMKISTRLSAVMATLALALIIVGSIGLFGIARTNAALKTVYEDRTVCLAQLGDIERRMLDNQLQIYAAATDQGGEELSQRVEAIQANLAASAKTWKDYTATYLTAEEAQLAKTFGAQQQAFLESGVNAAVTALKMADQEKAKQVLVVHAEPLFLAADQTLRKLVKLQIDVARDEYLLSVGRYDMLRMAAIGAVILGLLASGLLGWLTLRNIGFQLGAEPHEVMAITRSIASGNLVTAIFVPPGAERSVLASVAKMQQGLREVVGSVLASSDSIATGVTQIATGNNDLSHRTEEQASNLQQTAASMEQLNSRVLRNAETAHEAATMAATASEVAAAGGSLVKQVVATMHEISRSSTRIADIIGVIDGIAFQTNILALNAAVEAARAGEQGRGFAVVASEVRSLAQRSAEAAKEIKSLINTSVECVGSGSRLVGEAGNTMTEIVEHVHRVTEMIKEISLASGEQTTGLGQVSDAVAQLDQVTQQNAALVEQSAAAAESLRYQAEQLVEAVAVFKLG